MAQPDSRELRQMRHDVEDVYRLLTETQTLVESAREATGAVWSAQRRHGTRLEEIQQSLDLQNIRMDRMEDTQRQQGDRLGRVEIAQREQGERLGRVEGRLEGVEGRLENVDGRLQNVDGRLGRIEDTQQEILALLRGRSSG